MDRPRWLGVVDGCGAALLSVLAFACEPVDLTDCAVVPDAECTRERPAGLVCGLVHERARHAGVACDGTHDPAGLFTREGIESRTPDAGSRCPPGHVPVNLSDFEAARGFWSCSGSGTASFDVTNLRDVPAGTVCGLGAGGQYPGACQGFAVEQGECPPGMTWRWIPDRFTDRLNLDTCLPDETVTGFTYNQTRVVGFCEVDVAAGCAGDACRPLPGVACGLHARPADVTEVEVPVVPRVMPPEEREDRLEFLARCGNVYAPGLSIAALEAGVMAEAQCEGVPVSEGCPPGRELVCTPEYIGETLTLRFGWCWCDVPGVALSWADGEGF